MKAKKHLLIIGLFVLLTILLTFPLVRYIDKPLSIDPKDSIQFMWNTWWAEKSFEEDSFFHTNYLYAPKGVDITYHSLSLFNAFLGIPFAKLWGPIASYNLLVVFSFILAGYFMYLFVHYLTKHHWAALFAGVLYAFSPWHIFRSLHHLNFASIQFIPLYLLFLFKLRDKPYIKNALYAALVLAGIFYMSLYYALYLLLFSVLFLCYTWIVAKKVVRKQLYLFGLVMGLFLILTLPHLIPLLQNAGPHIAPEQENNVLDPLSYFVRPTTSTFFPQNGTGDYVGFTVLILAGFGVWYARKETRFWMYSTLLFFVLSLGKKGFVIGGHHFLNWLPMPASLFSVVPVFNALRLPRFGFITLFCMIILAAYGIRGLMQKKFSKKQKKMLFLVVLGVVLLVDFLAIPLPMYPYIIKQKELSFYSGLLHDDNRAVLNLPVGMWTLNERGLHARNMYAQLYHGKPIMSGVIARIQEEPVKNLYNIYLWDIDTMQKNIRYVVVHRLFLQDSICDTFYSEEYKGSISCNFEKSQDKVVFLNNFVSYIWDTKVFSSKDVWIFDLDKLSAPGTFTPEKRTFFTIKQKA